METNETILNRILKKLTENINVNMIDSEINGINMKLVFHRYLADLKRFNKDLTGKISLDNYKKLETIYPGVYYKTNLLEKDLYDSIFSGNIFLAINDVYYLITCQTDMKRSISDSIIEPNNILGARDGFIESIETNISLIQKRIRSTGLTIEKFNIGERSNTTVNVLYIKDIADKRNVDKVLEKLTSVITDSFQSINEITYLFEKNSLFPMCSEIGSPDLAAQELIEGRILIMIDQLPVAVTLPVTITYFFSLKEGRHSKPPITLYSRIIIAFCLFFGVYFLGIYAAIITHHTNTLSLIIISEIKSSLQGSTLPLFLEFFFLTFLFDILRLSSAKSPNISLQNVIITVGGLLIGQNAVNSGFISSFNLVIIAIAHICTYAITNNQRFITSLSVLGMFLLLTGMILGLYGLLISLIVVTCYLSRKLSITTPYFEPVSPFIKEDFLKLFFGNKIKKRKKRDYSLETNDNTRGIVKK